MKRILLALTLLPAASCDFIHDPTPIGIIPDEQVVVQSVLRAGSDTVMVRLTRGAYISEQDSSIHFAGIDAAYVRILDGRDTIRLIPGLQNFPACHVTSVRYTGYTANPSAGSGCYGGVLPAGVRAGARYRLDIILPEDRRIQGAATIPARPIIERPAEPVRVSLRSSVPTQLFIPDTLARIPVRWRPGGPSAAFAVSLVSGAVLRQNPIPGANCDFGVGLSDDVRTAGLADELVIAGDSLDLVVNRVSCSDSVGPTGVAPILVWDSIRARVQVTAFDSAYRNYAVHTVDQVTSVRSDRASAGVTGAFGIFAGAASATREVILLPDAGYSRPQVYHFLDLTLGASEARLRRWTGEWRMRVHGEPTAGDSAVLDQVSADIERLTGLTIRPESESPNVDIYIIPQSEFGTFEPNYSGDSPGFFWVWWNSSYEIQRARIMIASDVDAAERARLIRHFMTRSLGFFGYDTYNRGVFYGDESGGFPPIDRLLIRTLYRAQVQPGMSYEEVRVTLEGLERP